MLGVTYLKKTIKECWSIYAQKFKMGSFEAKIHHKQFKCLKLSWHTHIDNHNH